jgi:hypothetical protein
VTAIDVGGLAPAAVLAAVALAAAWAIDHPRLNRPTRRLEVTLELVFADPEALRRHLEERLNAQVTEARVVEIDYVRETTRAVAHYVAGPRTRPVPEQALDATVAGRAR